MLDPVECGGLVLDTSVWINLLATEATEAILGALGVPCHAPEQVVMEVRRHPVTGVSFHADTHPLRQMAPKVLVVSLDSVELDVFLEIVGAHASDALGDGEAAAIAVAASRGLDLVIDDRKARRILRERFSQVRIYWTVDLLRATSVIAALGAPSPTNASQGRSASGACMCLVPKAGRFEHGPKRRYQTSHECKERSRTMSATQSKVLRGRQFFANPGPTNIPDSVLRAIDRPTIDFHDPDFMEVYDATFAGLKRILGTQHHLFMYTGSGHAAWEATLTNLLSPGDTILLAESGYFSEEWGKMAAAHALEVRTVAADWRHGVDVAAIKSALTEDSRHVIRAVCIVHNETATGMFIPLQEVRAAIDATGHPALFLVDTISSLASLDFRMDEWKIDGVVGGSQKGLMCPTGVSFTGVSEKALAAHKTAKLARFYFDWTMMLGRQQKSFIGTVPVNSFYGLRESVRLLEEEGMENVVARHHYLAEGVRRCVNVWAGNNGPQLFCTNPARYSDSVTALLMPEGHNAETIRRTARGRYNVSLGGGLGKLNGRVFRIGHLGDLNEAMVLGALTAVEMSLRIDGVPHGKGGVEAAMEWFAT